jgi:hypothetical protein
MITSFHRYHQKFSDSISFFSATDEVILFWHSNHIPFETLHRNRLVSSELRRGVASFLLWFQHRQLVLSA